MKSKSRINYYNELYNRFFGTIFEGVLNPIAGMRLYGNTSASGGKLYVAFLCSVISCRIKQLVPSFCADVPYFLWADIEAFPYFCW